MVQVRDDKIVHFNVRDNSRKGIMKVIITHQNADFDGLASMLGVRKLWPDHHIVLSSAVSPPVQKYLALHKDWLTVQTPSQVSDEAVTDVVIVDARDRRRLSDFSGFFEGAESITVFDHHPAGPDDVDATTEIVEPVGACATLLCERIEMQEIKLEAEEATLMMLGIYADTGNLSFPSTTVRDLRAAAFLRQSGASLPVVNRYLQQEYSPEQQQLLVALMNEVQIISRQGLQIGCASYETPVYVKGASQVVERVLQLMGLDACFAVLQVEGKDSVALIGRSGTRHVNAAHLAELWDGGGHPSAAAARTSDASRDEVMRRLIQELEEAVLEPLEVSDVMSTPVQVVSHDTKLEQLQPMLEKWAISGVPVMRDREVVGIVSLRDVDDAARRGDWSIPVSGFMSHAVVTVGPEQSLNEVLELMTDRDIGRLPVVEGEELLGIVSRSDILARLYGSDAEPMM